MITFSDTAKFNQQATVILVEKSQVEKKKFAFSNREVIAELLRLSKAKQFSGNNGEIFPCPFKNTLLLFVGLGDKDDITLTNVRIQLKTALSSAYLKDIKSIEILSSEQSDVFITAVIEGILIGTYKWRKYLSSEKEKSSLLNKKYSIIAKKKKIFDDVITICKGTNFARDLINDNADLTNSAYLEKIIKGLIKGKKNVSIEILNKKQMQAKGLNLHLAVNKGSKNEPKLIIVKYKGAGSNGNYTALVGKGMTYDTGGLNLKPTGSMETMKIDMSGAAAVIGTLKNILDLKPKKNILFTVGIAENTIDAESYKPGDVFKSYSGKTVEIANTDAEGRLVLADAISYVTKNYEPSKLIDIATLTGACVVALANDYSGLVSTDDNLARQLIKSSNETDDRIWRLPNYPELKPAVKSHIADIRNLGFPKGAGGAITAAEFLRQFVGKTTWAHLDIAGTAYVEGCRWYYGYGATGAGVRLLTHYLINN